MNCSSSLLYDNIIIWKVGLKSPRAKRTILPNFISFPTIQGIDTNLSFSHFESALGLDLLVFEHTKSIVMHDTSFRNCQSDDVKVM